MPFIFCGREHILSFICKNVHGSVSLAVRSFSTYFLRVSYLPGVTTDPGDSGEHDEGTLHESTQTVSSSDCPVSA